MAFDISKFNRRYEFEFESTTLGRLYCRVLSLNGLRALEKILADKSLTGRPFVVKLLEKVAERVPEAEEEVAEAEQEGTPITADEADQLTDDEIEAFATEFLAHNPSLMETYEGAAKDIRTNEKGEKVVSITPRPVDLPKESGESDSDYLARVVRRYLDEQARRLKEITKPLSDLFKIGIFKAGLFRGFGLSKTAQDVIFKRSGLSNTTQDVIRENLFLSDRLRGVTGALDTSVVRSSEMPRLPEKPENPIYETNRRLNDVLDHMDGLRPLVAESANLIRSMNDASIRMLGDFGRNARRTEIYTWIIIGIAALGLVVTAVYSVLNYTGRETAAAQSNQLIEQFAAQMQALSEAQDQRTERMVGQFGAQMQSFAGAQDQRTESMVTEFQALLSKQSAQERSAFVDALKEAIERLQHDTPPAGTPLNSDKAN